MEQVWPMSALDVQNEELSKLIASRKRDLLGYIRKRILKTTDANDVLQEVWIELVETYRLMKPVEQPASWLYTVARNKIIDTSPIAR